MIYFNRDKYEGAWSGDEIKGKGIYNKKNGIKFDGFFVNGIKNFRGERVIN